MSSPAITPQGSSPVLFPDGEVHMIPPDNMAEATNPKNGGELAHKLIFPGEDKPRWVPHSQLSPALQAGGKPADPQALFNIAATQRTPSGVVVSPDAGTMSNQPGGLSHFGSNLMRGLGLPGTVDEWQQAAAASEQKRQYALQHPIKAAVSALPEAIMGPVSQLGNAYSGENLTNIRDAYNRSGGMSNGASGIPNAVPYAIAGAVPFIGSTIQKGMKQAETGDYSGAAGTATGLALPAMLGSALEGRMASIRSGGVLPKTPLSELPIEHAQAVTRAVNPEPEVAQRFQRNFAQAAPDIQAAAQKNGIPLEADRAGGIKLTEQGGIDVRQHLADATRAAADQHKNYYYDTFINPIRDEAVQVGADPRNKMSIGAMDSRLTDINALLNPKYDKGGAAARAALAPEQTVALQAEAAQIRSTMNGYIAQRFGLTPADISGQRQRFGVLYDLEDKIRGSANDAQAARNDARRAGPSFNPLSNKFFGNAAIKAVWPNPDAAIGNAFSDPLLPRDVPRPQQTPPPLNNYMPRVPLWDQPQSSQSAPTITNTRLSQSADASAFQSRATDVRANNAAVDNARNFLRQQIEDARKARLARQGRP